MSSFILQSKDAALNIAIAQGIALTVAGTDLSDSYQVPDEIINPYCDDACLGEFLKKIIQMVADPNPASRTSTGIWLLALVKNFPKRAPIFKHKEILQYAFTELLSDDSGELFSICKQQWLSTVCRHCRSCRI